MNTPHVDQQFLLWLSASFSGCIPLFQWILVENILENGKQIFALKCYPPFEGKTTRVDR